MMSRKRGDASPGWEITLASYSSASSWPAACRAERLWLQNEPFATTAWVNTISAGRWPGCRSVNFRLRSSSRS